MFRWFFGDFGYRKGYRKVHHSSNGAKGVRLNAQEPVGFHVAQEGGAGHKHNAFVLEHIQQGNADTCDHAGDGPFFIHPFVEDTHHQHWENRRGCQAEGQCHRSRGKIRWIKAQIAGQCDGSRHGQPAGVQFLLLGDVRHEYPF